MKKNSKKFRSLYQWKNQNVLWDLAFLKQPPAARKLRETFIVFLWANTEIKLRFDSSVSDEQLLIFSYNDASPM